MRNKNNQTPVVIITSLCLLAAIGLTGFTVHDPAATGNPLIVGLFDMLTMIFTMGAAIIFGMMNRR